MVFEAGCLEFVGRGVFRAFRYKPQALQIVEPVGERRHSGVWVVPQLLQIVIHLSMTGFRDAEARKLTCTPGPLLELQAHTVIRIPDRAISNVWSFHHNVTSHLRRFVRYGLGYAKE